MGCGESVDDHSNIHAEVNKIHEIMLIFMT